MPLIVEIAPGFRERWKAHLNRWGDEPAGIYNDIGAFAHYVVDSYDSKDTSWYSEFFDFVERLIVDGNDTMKELAVIGFLETIQTIASWKPHKGRVFVKWLRPESRKAWKKLDSLWSKYGSLPNIIRAEKYPDQ